MNNLAVYGTLKGWKSEGVQHIGKCLIPGKMYQHSSGRFPCLVDVKGRFAQGELLKVSDDTLDFFDLYEGAHNAKDPFYIRTEKEILYFNGGQPHSIQAFVYYYNQPVLGFQPIETGVW